MVKFLSNNLWETIESLSKKAKRTKIAVAYFGTSGASQLKFKKGDVLLVAMTINNVKAGQVNPFEIERLYNKGCQIFNLPNLHAKIYLFDKKVIIGSPNVSFNSVDTLIETGILTDDNKIVLSTSNFIKEHCIEKVEQDYIDICKKKYNPPKFFGNRQKRATTSKFQGQLSRLWFTRTENTDFKDEDWDTLEQDGALYEGKISNNRVFEVDSIRYPASSTIIQQAREGDIIIEVIGNKVRTKVIEPKRVLGITWNKRKSHGFLRVEERKKIKSKSWTGLQNILRRNGIKTIKKNSNKEIKNESVKKMLHDYFN